MKRFGFKVIKQKNLKYYLNKIRISFFVLTFFSLALFSIYSNITNILFAKNKVDIFEHKLTDIAMYFKRYDKSVSDFILQIDKVAKDYFKWKNIFITQSWTLDQIFDYIKNKKNYLTKIWFENYKPILDFVVKALNYKNDIYNLLGKNWEKNYIVILQNTAEKRPNWWFFGSFWFITIQSWFIKNIEIIDSYYPNWIAPNIKLQAPKRSWKFIPDKLIWFISANKFWFTNIDGRNIKNLYNHIFNNPKIYNKKKEVIKPNLFEHTFNKKVNWIIFIRSDILSKIIPWLQQKLREREFINANTDLLKTKEYNEEKWLTWTQLSKYKKFSNKKQKYIQEVNDFLHKKQDTIFKNLVKDFKLITSQKYFNIYLDTKTTNISQSGLIKFLENYNLSTNYSSWYFYFRDSNNSYNKVDTFVNKKILLYDSKWNLLATWINDMIDIQKLNLKPWKYTIKIKYFLDIPQYYKNFMHWLEKKYWIKMTERELGILWLQPAKEYTTWKERYRSTRATIYFPKNVKILNVVGDFNKEFKFYPTFANWLYYEMTILKNKTEKWIRIEIEIK